MTDDRPISTYHVFAVSDGTGATAERVIRAALTQFTQPVEVERFGEVRSVDQIRELVRRAADEGAFIVHTLVRSDLRDAMFEEGRRYHISTLDLMGPLLERLSDLLGVQPLARPGLYGPMTEAYYRRIEAIEFAMGHDDGQHIDELDRAEIVLVGVSRTGKTPLSMYLAYRGWLVGNVPIVLGMEPPRILFDLPPGRVIGLTVEPKRLATLRRARAERLGGRLREYTDFAHVREEIRYAWSVFHRRGWPTVDMTSKPVEEAAAEVVSIVSNRSRREGEQDAQ